MKAPLAFLAAAAAALLLAPGCESSGGNGGGDFELGPEDQVVSKPGQTVTLRSSGSSGYAWSLKRPEIGRLSATAGDTVVYTATAIPETPVEQEVRVVDADGRAEDVDILHRR